MRAQRGYAAGQAVGGNMNVTPGAAMQLLRRHDLARVGDQYTQNRQFLRGQVDRVCFSKKGSVRRKTKGAKTVMRAIWMDRYFWLGNSHSVIPDQAL